MYFISTLSFVKYILTSNDKKIDIICPTIIVLIPKLNVINNENIINIFSYSSIFKKAAENPREFNIL